MTTIVTVGHGNASAEAFAARLTSADIARLVDVRSQPGSRRHPQFGRAVMGRWLGEAGIAYAWLPDLGGRRQPRPRSRHVALAEGGFQAYADHMATPTFRAGVGTLLGPPDQVATAIMCSESAWRSCHRSLLADHLALVRGVEVLHLLPDGRIEPHVPTPGVRLDGDDLVYDLGVTPPLLD